MWDSVERYLRSGFLTLEQLVERSGVSAGLIRELSEHGCLPRPSYRVSSRVTVASHCGERSYERSEEFYHPSLVALARRLADAARSSPMDSIAVELRSVFEAEYRSELARTGACETGLLAGVELDELIASEWRAWCDGVYGLCTRDNDVPGIVRKEMAVRRIRAITSDGARARVDAEEREALDAAVRALDEAAAPFAPDEREQSSRGRWVDDVRERYGLPTAPREA
jgi:hypothetical protein